MRFVFSLPEVSDGVDAQDVCSATQIMAGQYIVTTIPKDNLINIQPLINQPN